MINNKEKKSFGLFFYIGLWKSHVMKSYRLQYEEAKKELGCDDEYWWRDIYWVRKLNRIPWLFNSSIFNNTQHSIYIG